MRKFAVYEPSDDDPQDYENNAPVIYTEDEIKNTYFIMWSERMRQLDKPEYLINFENCLEDWITINWAVEIT